MMLKGLLLIFAVMQVIAILLGMINAGDWNIGHWDAETRNTVATLPVSIAIIIALMAASATAEGKK
jgi:hypothetical protein